MLRKVANFTTQEWEKNYETFRKKNIDEFRQEIRVIPEREAAISEIAKLDGFISLFMIIKIFEELQAANEKALEAVFQEHSGKELKRVISKKGIRDIIKTAMGKDVRAYFEELSEKTRMEALTLERVQATVTPVVQTVYDKLFRKFMTRDGEIAEQRLKMYLCNAVFLICATELYKEADLRQTAGSIRIKLLMGPYLLKSFPAESLQNPFIAVREGVNMIEIDPAVKPLWEEAALWLQGLFMRSYLQVPERYRRDGEVIVNPETQKMPVVNEKDVAFQDNFGLTLFEMARFHGQTSQLIQNKLTPPVKVDVVVASSSHDQSEPLPVVSVMQVASALNDQAAESLIPQVKKPEKPLLSVECLNDIKDENESVLFPMLSFYLDKYRLSEIQVNLLLEFNGVISTNLKGYVNSSWTTSYIPTMIWSRPHVSAVNEMLEDLNQAGNASDSISLLFNLWKEIGEKGSRDLKGIVNDLIKSAFTILLKGAQLDEKQKLQPNALLQMH